LKQNLGYLRFEGDPEEEIAMTRWLTTQVTGQQGMEKLIHRQDKVPHV
jgi:hypothetical protein